MWCENVSEEREMSERISFNESLLILIFLLRYIFCNIEIVGNEDFGNVDVGILPGCHLRYAGISPEIFDLALQNECDICFCSV
jgi:hypothetical protein